MPARHERVVDLGQTALGHQVLEQDLVHADRAGGYSASDVRDVQQLEQALHRAVLAERAVQNGERDVAAEQSGAGSQRDRLPIDLP